MKNNFVVYIKIVPKSQGTSSISTVFCSEIEGSWVFWGMAETCPHKTKLAETSRAKNIGFSFLDIWTPKQPYYFPRVLYAR